MRRIFGQKLRIYKQNAEVFFCLIFPVQYGAFFVRRRFLSKLRKCGRPEILSPLGKKRSVRFYGIYCHNIRAPHFWTIYGMIRATATAATAAAATAAAAAVTVC